MKFSFFKLLILIAPVGYPTIVLTVIDVIVEESTVVVTLNPVARLSILTRSPSLNFLRNGSLAKNNVCVNPDALTIDDMISASKIYQFTMSDEFSLKIVTATSVGTL